MIVGSDNYLTAEPITYWTEKANQGNFYMSKPT